MRWISLGRSARSNGQRPTAPDIHATVAAFQQTGAAHFSEPQTRAAHYLHTSWQPCLLIYCGSTAKQSRCEHPQWSSRSPVWLTGDRGLCCAATCIVLHDESLSLVLAPPRSVAKRAHADTRGAGAPSVTSTSNPSPGSQPKVAGHRTLRGANGLEDMARYSAGARSKVRQDWGQ